MSSDLELKKRADKLAELGLKWDGDQYILGDINVHWTEITCMSDEKFENLCEEIKDLLNKRERLHDENCSDCDKLDAAYEAAEDRAKEDGTVRYEE